MYTVLESSNPTGHPDTSQRGLDTSERSSKQQGTGSKRVINRTRNSRNRFRENEPQGDELRAALYSDFVTGATAVAADLPETQQTLP
jgi:hypothetical protein